MKTRSPARNGKRSVGLAIALGWILATSAAGQTRSHDSVTFISGGPTGTWYHTAAAIAELVNKRYRGQPVSVIPGKGAISNPLSVGIRRAGFGFSYGPFLRLAHDGNNEVFEMARISEPSRDRQRGRQHRSYSDGGRGRPGRLREAPERCDDPYRCGAKGIVEPLRDRKDPRSLRP